MHSTITPCKITELPIGTWTDKYKEFLESMLMDVKEKNKVRPAVLAVLKPHPKLLLMYEGH